MAQLLKLEVAAFLLDHLHVSLDVASCPIQESAQEAQHQAACHHKRTNDKDCLLRFPKLSRDIYFWNWRGKHVVIAFSNGRAVIGLPKNNGERSVSHQLSHIQTIQPIRSRYSEVVDSSGQIRKFAACL